MPSTQIIDLTDEQRRDILYYFRHGRFTADVANVESVAGLDRPQIIRALVTAGLLRKLRGRTTGSVYILSDLGVMTCVVAATGGPVWQKDLDARFYASPVCVNGRIYLVTRSGEVIVLKAGPEFKLLAKSTLPETSDSTPAIANGRMYIRTLNHLICIGDAKAKN